MRRQELPCVQPATLDAPKRNVTSLGGKPATHAVPPKKRENKKNTNRGGNFFGPVRPFSFFRQKKTHTPTQPTKKPHTKNTSSQTVRLPISWQKQHTPVPLFLSLSLSLSLCPVSCTQGVRAHVSRMLTAPIRELNDAFPHPVLRSLSSVSSSDACVNHFAEACFCQFSSFCPQEGRLPASTLAFLLSQ